MGYHMSAFLLGYILDLLIGDPWNIPHPIRWIGRLIHRLDEDFLNPKLKESLNGQIERNSKQERRLGLLTVLVVLCVTSTLTAVVIVGGYCLHPVFGVLVEAVLTCYILAARSLEKESMKVYDALTNGTLSEARYAVSMIVGRDTASLDASGVTRAAVETVAENTSDGVIAPLIYTCFGGPILGMTYKAVNTMDSMIGYHNDRYEDFGYFAAGLDDVVNYLPSRISGFLMVAASFFMGRNYNTKNAWKIFQRDRYNHKSPNSAQTESACAGALGLRLAGDASYFGKIVHKPYIGDALKDIEPRDIVKACRLMFVTEFLVVLVCISIMWGMAVITI